MTFLITVALLGLITGAIASKKGHSFGKWWFYGAAMFIIALPMAIMLKPVGDVTTGNSALTGGLRKCPKCAELIQPDACVCRFCNAETTPMTAEELKQAKEAVEKELKKANNVPGWLVAAALIGMAIFIYVKANEGTTSSGGGSANPITQGIGGVLASDYVIKVTGSDKCKFSGSYMLVTADGQSQSKSVEGRVPAEYTASGSIVSTSFQKQAENGILKVQILKGGKLVNESETTAAYGVVSAASN